MKPHEYLVTQDWELDFSELVPCDHCGTMGSLLDMVEVRKRGTVEPINLRFCNQDCANDWYIAFLRRNEK